MATKKTTVALPFEKTFLKYAGTHPESFFSAFFARAPLDADSLMALIDRVRPSLGKNPQMHWTAPTLTAVNKRLQAEGGTAPHAFWFELSRNAGADFSGVDVAAVNDEVLYQLCDLEDFQSAEFVQNNKERKLHWHPLITSKLVAWTEALVDEVKDHVSWDELSQYWPLPWNEAVIARHQDRWNTHRLAMCETYPWTDDRIAALIATDMFAVGYLQQNDGVRWTAARVARHGPHLDDDHARRLLDSDRLEVDAATIAALEGLEDQAGSKSDAGSARQRQPAELGGGPEGPHQTLLGKLNWRDRSRHPMSADVMERFADVLDWQRLSGTAGPPWSDEVIARFAERIDFSVLGNNAAVPWSIELIERYADRFEWRWFSQGLFEHVPFSEATLARFADRIDWSLFCAGASIPWSEEILKSHADRINWNQLSRNPSFMCDADLVTAHINALVLGHATVKMPWEALRPLLLAHPAKVEWSDLIRSEYIRWDDDLFAAAGDRLDLAALCLQETAPWSIRFIEKNRAMIKAKSLFKKRPAIGEKVFLAHPDQLTVHVAQTVAAALEKNSSNVSR